MRWFDILRMRLRSLFRRARVERELDEELRYHLDRETDFNIAQGMSPDEARFAALRDISDIELRREECRDMRRVNWIENAIADMRFAARGMLDKLGLSHEVIRRGERADLMSPYRAADEVDRAEVDR